MNIKNFIKSVIFLCAFNANFIVAMELRAYNVGQKNSNVVLQQGTMAIFDCGKLTDALMRTISCNNVSYVFISHLHTDHIVGIVDSLQYNHFMRRLENACFVLGANENVWKTSAVKACKDLMRLLEGKRYCYLDGKAGKWPWGNAIIESFALPQNYFPNTSNSWSQPIKVTFQGKSILFTGDADYNITNENRLPPWRNTFYCGDSDCDHNYDDFGSYSFFLKQDVRLYNENLYSNIVILPHHGSCAHFSYTFHQLAKRAQCSIICSDPRTMHGLPKMKTLEAIIGALDGNLIRESHSVYYDLTTVPVYLTSESNGYYNIVINQHYCALWNHNAQIGEWHYTGGNYGRVSINSFDNPTSQLISLSNSKKIYEKVFDIDLETLRYDCKQRIKKGMYVSVEDKNAMKTASLWQKKLQWNSPYLLKNALNITVRLKGNNEFIEAKGTCSYKKEIVKNKYKLVSAFTRKEDDISKAITKQLAKAGRPLSEISTVTVEISKKKNAVKCKHTIIDCK